MAGAGSAAPPAENLYEFLGVDNLCEPDEIYNAFRSMVMELRKLRRLNPDAAAALRSASTTESPVQLEHKETQQG